MVHQERDILVAAEALLGSSSSYQHNVNNIINVPMDHVTSTDDLIAGARDGEKMSSVRRFFCLFVTFDLLFIILMWLICLMLTGDDVFSALNKEVVRYNIHSSLFDLVMAASCRFVLLLLFYALLKINHWFVIALSTSGTCAFLIAKVFIYNWPKAQASVFQVLLILISFVLAWGEAWFLDFRVLPEESQASEIMQATSILASRASERASLLQSFLRTTDHHAVPESVRNYYSPVETPHGSDEELDAPPQRPSVPETVKREQLLSQANDIVEIALRCLQASDWKLEKTTVQGDVIHSRKLVGNKIYRMIGIVETSPELLLYILHNEIEDLPTWNPAVTECKIVQVIDSQTDIIYQVTAEAGGGIIASRDFINLRHWVEIDNSYVAASASVEHSDHPPCKKYIRGEHGPSAWVLRRIENEPNECSFEWLLNTNLRGWLPQSVVDAAFANAMKDYMGNLRNLLRQKIQHGTQRRNST